MNIKRQFDDEAVQRVRAAVEIIRTKAPPLLVDGELQLDAAIVPEVAARKVSGDGPVAGREERADLP